MCFRSNLAAVSVLLAIGLSTEAFAAPLTQLPPFSSLPTAWECAADVEASPRAEVRPENTVANRRKGTLVMYVDGASAEWNARYKSRVVGDYQSGTTEEILRWASCNWGLDEDVTKARAIAESDWRQSAVGDINNDPAVCQRIGRSAPCPESYGILQVRGTVHEGTYPQTRSSTAANADYASAWQRACYDGQMAYWKDYMGPNGAQYRAGDLWGCVGMWYSGQWYDQGASNYIAAVQRHLRERPWERPGF